MIKEKYASDIKAINMDAERFVCDFSYWRAEKYLTPVVANRIGEIEEFWGDGVVRSKIVQFYKEKRDPVTKFLLAMIWGHCEVDGGRPDHRGPWKMSQVFSAENDACAIQAITSVKIETDEEIAKSYESLRCLKRCGPNFFTKHFYFLGKATGATQYPLIFDARVAAGLLRANGLSPEIIRMVSVDAEGRPAAYMSYLRLCRDFASQFDCEMDQVELFLFKRSAA